MTTRSRRPKTPSFDADQPVFAIKHDRFSRAPFAKGVATAIRGLSTNEGFVAGIHGLWGDGKSTVLNFVEAYLKTTQTSVVRYNPWRFLNEEAMLSHLFGTLASAVRLELNSKTERLAGAVVKFGKYVAPFHSGAGALVAAAEKKNSPQLEELRERLRKGLRELKKRIVVLVDDIDRLDAEETAALFRLIKACTDFPNVVYVLAFDREVVAVTLGNRLIGGGANSGHRFLEKIIQIPLSLPPASQADLNRALFTGVQDVLTAAKVSVVDSEVLRFHATMREGISPRLRTPRNVSQYLNAVRFAVPMLAGEVNIIDLLLIEALRIFYPSAYEVVRGCQTAFVGAPTSELERRHGHSPQEDLLAPARTGMTSSESDGLDRLIESLFPRYHSGRRSLSFGIGSVASWTDTQRICAPEYGPRYFSYTVGSSDVADKEIEAIIDAAGKDDPAVVLSRMHPCLDSLKQGMLLAKLHAQRAALGPVAARNISIALAANCSEFPEPFSIHDGHSDAVRAASFVADLFNQHGKHLQGQGIGQAVLEHSDQMWFTSVFMTKVDRHLREPGDTSRLEPLRALFLAKMDEFLRSGTTMLDLERRWKFETMFVWARSGGRTAIKDRFVTQMGADGSIAIQLLKLLTQPIWRSGELTPSPGDLEPRNLDELSILLDVDEMMKAIEPWMHEGRTKGPEHWEAMKLDDRLMAQLYHLYPKWSKSSKIQT